MNLCESPGKGPLFSARIVLPLFGQFQIKPKLNKHDLVYSWLKSSISYVAYYAMVLLYSALISRSIDEITDADDFEKRENSYIKISFCFLAQLYWNDLTDV